MKIEGLYRESGEMKSVFLDAEGLEDCRLAELHEAAGTLQMYSNTRPEDAVERIGDAEVVIVNKVRMGRDVLAACPSLRLVSLVATGSDCVDLVAARKLGIAVCNCRAYGTDSVVQHVFGVILALHTNLIPYQQAVREGRWQRASQFCFLDYPIRELKGKTLGIVGLGTLGKGVAAMAEAFGMRVVATARPGSVDDPRPRLSDLLPELDVLTLHCPLTEHTRGLVGAAELAAMKPSAFLINVARGGIVDEVALAAALRERRIAGAAVDVLSTEPPGEGNPLLGHDLPNLILTPHIAWASSEARQRIIDQTVENIVRWRTKTPVRLVAG